MRCVYETDIRADLGEYEENQIFSEDLSEDTWYHVAVVRTDSKLLLYVNSELHAQKNITSDDLTNSRDLYIGADPDHSSENFEGIIDDLRMYNIDLNSSEIDAIYDNYAIPSVVGHWAFNETSGTNAYDDSDNGNNGTLTNGPTWTTGVNGNAIQFDGSNDYVQIENSEDYR